ncbi:endo alpha-1,4 polygalactosaminidase [Microbulbifer taiwanensis]|uniref:endo alpha-1,4 polygalactosaminidase n=1 Tax=Microbulbifer taiwanensis TaxID=986746 RepID=UPI001866247E
MDQLSLYSRAVVLPENLDTPEERNWLNGDTAVIAYLSLGEVAENAHHFKRVKPHWKIAFNANWQSHVMDVASPEWHRFVIEELVAPLVRQGYRGLFLDTLDSYLLADARAEHYGEGLARLIHKIHARWPELYLIANRGFEIMPQVAPVIDELVAESLFSRFDAGRDSYGDTTEEQQAWLIARLKEIREHHRLPITVIDYLPESQFERAAALAERIAALGFNPWITNGHLTLLGRNRVVPIPRRILAIYHDRDRGTYYSRPHQSLASTAEYLGYQLDYLNLHHQMLPDYPLTNRYAGVALWLGEDIPHSAQLCRWLERRVGGAGLRVAIFGNLPNDPSCLQRMGLESIAAQPRKFAVAQARPQAIGYETKARPRLNAPVPFRSVSGENRPWLILRDSEGMEVHPVLTGPWGGMALGQFALDTGAGNMSYWVVNPELFLRESLALEDIPAPDFTTENGLQIATVHIDGDGLVSRSNLPGKPLAGQVILDQFIRGYDLPTTVSVIEGEVSPAGVYPQQSPQAIAIARAAFREPNVELASHSFSHPYFWEVLDNPTVDKDLGYGTHLPVPGYETPQLEREVLGSVSYINGELAPPEKRVRVFLWSGDALPSAKTVRMTREAGLFNVNGADNRVLRSSFSLSRVWPVGRPLDGEYQIYAPVMNENVYTNLWQGPYYGYRNVIDTFRALSAPRRLKPLGIYYHFYSGSEKAAVRALHQVYRYVQGQPINPMYLSDYAKRARGFYSLALGRDTVGNWHIANTGALRTLRIDDRSLYPDMDASRGIAGYLDTDAGRYLHLSAARALLTTTGSQPAQPHLVQFGGRIHSWEAGDNAIELALQTEMATRLTVAQLRGECALHIGDDLVPAVSEGYRHAFALDKPTAGAARIVCSNSE